MPSDDKSIDSFKNYSSLEESADDSEYDEPCIPDILFLITFMFQKFNFSFFFSVAWYGLSDNGSIFFDLKNCSIFSSFYSVMAKP